MDVYFSYYTTEPIFNTILFCVFSQQPSRKNFREQREQWIKSEHISSKVIMTYSSKFYSALYVRKQDSGIDHSAVPSAAQVRCRLKVYFGFLISWNGIQRPGLE